MALTKCTLGSLIELSTDTNADLLYGADAVRGMTITKQIIPTKADVSATDLSKFLIVSPEEFVYNPRTHGKKIGFGYNDSTETFLISWNNIAFRVRPEKRTEVLPEYLFLHFNRSEWDREACYRSWGSSTEVFSWDALCEMEIGLPEITIQKKYVEIYNAMVENQRSYEQGLEDLKQAVFAEIDIIKHSAPKVSVGELLEEIDVRNTEGTVTNVQGINIEKQFMPSVADTTSVNLKNYKIVRNGQFSYSSMQTGRDKCIRIALYDKDEPILISPAYSVLQVKDSSAVAEYIMLWFSRPETDRYGWFASDASVRANLDLDRFYEIQIPLPSIDKQHSVANIYIAYMLRREINEQLKAQIKDICPILIKGSLIEEKRKEAFL